jgi:hypothetical protein
MIRVFNKLLAGNTMFPIQQKQYKESIPLEDSVPGGETKLCKVNVSTLGHFLCLSITGTFETLASVDYEESAKIIDDGICHLRGKLSDGNGQKLLFSNHVPLDLFCSPGRRRSALAVNNLLDVPNYADKADGTTGLFFPFDMEYLFSANTDILFEVKNDSNTEIAFALLFSGIRVISK